MPVLRGMASTVLTCYVVLGLIVAGILLMVITAACAVNSNSPTWEMAGLADSADDTELWTGEFVRPACAPVPGWDRDPCRKASSVQPQADANSAGYGFPAPPLPLDPEWLYRVEWTRQGVRTPQVVLRGVVVPNSARCSEARGSIGFGWYGVIEQDAEHARVLCYVDIDVSEYLASSGPSRLTVIPFWRRSVPTDTPGFGTREYFVQFASPVREHLEGFEFVFELARPYDLAWGEWYLVHSWDVLRRDDGTIVGRSAKWGVFGGTTAVEDWEYPIDELQRMLQAAHVKVAAEYGGRISDEPGSPMLVTDASRESLLAQLRELGAYDAPDVTPAPAPTAEPWDGYE